MDTKTKSNTKTIQIAGMSTNACVQQVIAVLKRVSGVRIEAVQVGTATITCGYPAALGTACAALARAGFKSHEAGRDQPPAPSPIAAEPSASDENGGPALIALMPGESSVTAVEPVTS